MINTLNGNKSVFQFSQLKVAGAAVTSPSTQNLSSLSPSLKIDKVSISEQSKKMADAFLNEMKLENASASKNNNNISISDFSNEMQKRLETYQQNNPQTAKAAGQENDALLRSLTNTVHTIAEECGDDYAEEAMTNILSYTANGVSAETIAAGLSTVLDKLEADGATNLDAVMRTLVADDAYNFAANQAEADEAAQDESRSLGLGYALNRYFAKTGKEDNDSEYGEFKSFNNGSSINGWYHDETFNDTIASDGMIYYETGESAAGFSGDKLDEAIINQLADFINNEIANKELGEQVAAKLSASGSFMAEVADVVAQVYKENGAESAQKLVNYLNDHLKSAINANSDITNASGSQTSFTGWSLKLPEATDDEMSQLRGSHISLGLDESWFSQAGGQRNIRHSFTESRTDNPGLKLNF